MSAGGWRRPTVQAQPSEEADLVLLNGKIITVDATDSIAQAVAVKDGLISKVGSNLQVRALAGRGTKLMFLNGKTVTPGLIDAHNHLAVYGQVEHDFVNLRPPVDSIAEIVALIAERVGQVQPGEWVIGDGFFTLTDGRVPTRWDIDPVSPNNPVFLNSIGGHFATANSQALAIAGIDADTPNPVGGIIEKHPETGQPTGRLWNHPAMDLVRAYFPPLTVEGLVAAIKFAQDRFVAEGITTFEDVNTRGLVRLQAYEQAEDELKLRGYLLFTIERAQDAAIAIQQTHVFARPMLAYGGSKFLLDGQAPTSYTYEPHPGPSYDLPTWDPDTLKAVVKRLHQAGHQIAFHVMGDRAIDLALDAIEEALIETPRADHRHRLEHAAIPTAAAIERIKRLGVVVSTQPHVLYESGESLVSTWGPERAERLMPLRSFLDQGIGLALGSDFPTVPELSPQLTLWAAVTRQIKSGAVLTPNERITIREALRAHTMGSAYAAFEDNLKGSIEEGKFADFDVWSGDLYSVAADQIRNLKTVATIIGGKIVYLAGDVSGDGVVRTDDLVQLLRFLLQLDEPSEAQQIAADVNADNVLDMADVPTMIAAMFGAV
ncbi:MAG: amidohydrolase family protein [Deltaproteobacteria bacterium]|nr:amidohydrolase family protein [Deltaproteobacteria bacterium]